MVKNKAEELLDFNINDAKVDLLSVELFNDTYLRLYSAHSNVRGIPFIGDGLKEVQRKAIWGMMKRGENAGPITVERLSSACAAETDYHHGVGSMAGALVGMAQSFAGSNNMNLLFPKGQFGSRRSHGSAAPRYIFTYFDENFRKVFKKEDDIILEPMVVNEVVVEPKYFIPLLPMVLVNGSEGMGTGHATHILSYSPIELRDTIIKVLDGKTLVDFDLVPKWKDFIGTVKRNKETGQVTLRGKLEIKNSTTIVVSELPVGVESDKYEAYLHLLEDRPYPKKKLNPSSENPPAIKNFQNASDKNGFDFIVNVPRTTTYLEHEELIRLFKLETNDTENFTVWGPDGLITKYDSPEKLLLAFVAWRLLRYEERRLALMKATQEQIDWYNEAIRFIEFYLTHSQKFKNIPKAEMLKIITDAKFTQVDRLLNMPIWSLTKDRIDDLKDKLTIEFKKLEDLKVDTPDKMYRRELKALKLDL